MPFRALIESEIQIQAPVETVWSVLVDLDAYSTWNPFTPRVETDFQLGSDVVLHVRLKPGKPLHRQTEKMLVFAEGEKMAWGIDRAFPVRTIRVQKLERIDAQCTRYYTSDAFHGVLTPLVMAMYRGAIQRGFDDVGRALKARCEALATNQGHPSVDASAQ